MDRVSERDAGCTIGNLQITFVEPLDLIFVFSFYVKSAAHIVHLLGNERCDPRVEHRIVEFFT